MVKAAQFSAAAAAAAAIVVLAGCGSTPAGHRPQAAALLSSANNTALSTSFRAQFQGTAKVSMSGVSGLPAATMQQLQKAEGQLNSATLSGTLEFENSTNFEVTYSFPPFLTSQLAVLEVNGVGYASLNGTSWYALTSSTTTSAGLSAQMANLPSQLKALGTEAKGGATVSTLPDTTVDGVAVTHVRAVISGSGLDKIFTGALEQFAKTGSGSSAGGVAAALTQLVNFDPARADSYISQSSKLPVRETASGSMSFNLAALSLLGSGQIPQVQGVLSLSFATTINFGDYGHHFTISKPSDVVPGSLPQPSSPSSVSGLF
jgi:hypothetical protein